jgi:hypothetical protein
MSSISPRPQTSSIADAPVVQQRPDKLVFGGVHLLGRRE